MNQMERFGGADITLEQQNELGSGAVALIIETVQEVDAAQKRINADKTFLTPETQREAIYINRERAFLKLGKELVERFEKMRD